MVRYAYENELEKIIEFYNKVIEVNNASDINLRWQKNVHPSHKLIEESVLNHELFVYEENGEILAALIMNKSHNKAYNKVVWQVKAQENEFVVIHVFAVLPGQFRKGLGKKLLDGVIHHAKKENLKSIRLDVFKINLPAIKLYEKCGFKIIKELRMYVRRIGWEEFCLMEYKIKS